jgi:hypothetical protein
MLSHLTDQRLVLKGVTQRWFVMESRSHGIRKFEDFEAELVAAFADHFRFSAGNLGNGRGPFLISPLGANFDLRGEL